MADFYVGNTGGGDFEPIPAGVYPAWCYGLVDMGTQAETYQGKTSHRQKVRLLFELPLEKDKNGKVRTIGATVTANLVGDSNKLKKWLQSWRGKPFTKEESDRFKLSAVVGKGCQLVVINKPKGSDPSKVSDYIDNIMPVGKDPATGKPADYLKCSQPNIVFTIEGWDQQVYLSLPQWLQNKIAESPEGKAKMGGKPAPATGQQQPEPQDDSIPF